MSTHQAHKQALNKYLITRPSDVLLWQNDQGLAYMSPKQYRTPSGDLVLKNPRPVRFGLGGTGFPDLCGFTLTEITPDMVGKKLPIFSTAEIKQGKDRLRPEQKKWNNLLRDYGCNTKVIYYADGTFKELDF